MRGVLVSRIAVLVSVYSAVSVYHGRWEREYILPRIAPSKKKIAQDFPLIWSNLELMINRRINLVLLVSSMLFGYWGSQNTLGQDDVPLKVNTVILNVPVFVSDKDGKVVKGLTKGDFVLTVDGNPQKVDFFVDKGPANMAIVIDANSNTRDVLDRMKRDAQQLIDLLEPQDKAMVIRLDIGYKVMCELTSDKTKLKKAISKIDPHSDRIRAMDKVLHQVIFYELASTEGRTAVVAFGDPDSAIPLSNVWYLKHVSNWLAEADTPIYPIFYQTDTFPTKLVGKNLTLSQLVRLPPIDSFNLFAVLTGGQFYAAGATNFNTAFQHILDETRSQYVLGIYTDSNTGDQKNSKFSIKTVRKDLILRAKGTVRANPMERKKEVERYMIIRRQ